MRWITRGLTLIAAYLLLLAAGQSHARLMAIDLGGEFLKVSVVAPGRSPISIAINEMSRRKTPVLAGFVDGQRAVGEEAVTLSVRHPDKFFKLFRDLIGKPANDSSIPKMLEENLLHYDVVPDEARGTIRLRAPGFERPFLIEELLATEIAYAQRIAEAHLGVSIQSCVVLIPPYFGPSQRMAVMDAVELSGMSLLSLLHTHAAAALQYGIERDFSGKTENVVLYDVSSTDVVAALVRYSAYTVKGSPKQQSQVQVMDVAWREGIGASTLDGLLVRHFAKKFVEEHGTEDVLKHPKVVSKMAKPVRRTKEMLSANVDAPFIVEELFNGIDFMSSISRDEFETIAGPYWEAVKGPLAELLARNNLTSPDEFSLQLLGGGSRVPRVQAELEGVLPGLTLEKQLDADEAFALGGGLVAANLSTTFRLRPFGMHDGNMYPVSVALHSGPGVPDEQKDFFPENGGQVLMPYMKKMDSKRKVTFTGLTADPFQVSLSFSGDSKPCCLLTDKIVTYTVAGLNSAMERYNETGKVVLHFTLDSNGLLKMSNAEAVIQVEETIQVDKLVPDPDAAEDQKNVTVTGDAENKTETIGGSANATNSTNSTSTKPPAPKMKKIKVPEKVVRPRVVELQLGEEWHGLPVMNAAQKQESTELLRVFATMEHARAAAAMAKNTLESYIITTRSAINNDEDLALVTTEEMRDSFKEMLTDAEDWLYMDPEADKAEAEIFKAKLDMLQAVGDPMHIRMYEMQRRPDRMKKALELTDVVAMATNSWLETRPWLNSTRVETLRGQAREFKAWLETVGAEQEKKALHEDPAFMVSELQDRFEVVSKMFTKLNKIQAPPPPPAIEASNATANATARSNSTQADGANTSTPAQGAGDAETASQPPSHDELR